MKILISIIMLILITSLASASLGVFKQNECVQIRTILNTSSVNISTINYPNSSLAVSNKAMTKTSLTFNYTFCNTSDLGTYIYDYFDAEGNVYVNDFEITSNGKGQPSELLLVFFIIVFLILIGLTCYIAIYTIGHLISLDFDLTDLSLDWGLYFVILAVYYLEDYYLSLKFINDYFLWFISIGGMLLILVPIIAFILSITMGALTKKQWKANNQVPPRRFKLGGRHES